MIAYKATVSNRPAARNRNDTKWDNFNVAKRITRIMAPLSRINNSPVKRFLFKVCTSSFFLLMYICKFLNKDSMNECQNGYDEYMYSDAITCSL